MQSAGTQTQLQTATQAVGGAWSAPQLVHSSAYPISTPTLSLGASGHALLAWQERTVAGTNAPLAIRAAYRGTTGLWVVEDIPAIHTAQSWTLRSGMDANGVATLVWDDNYSLQMARRTTNTPTPWIVLADALASTPGNQYGYGAPFAAYAPDLAVTAAGDVLVAWLESETATQLWAVEGQLFSVDGAVHRASWPVIDTQGGAYPGVTMSQDGSMGAIAWIDSGTGNSNIASFSPAFPASSWGAPEVVPGSGLWGSQVALGSGLNSNISAVWLTTTLTEFKYKYVGSSYLP